MMEMRLLFKHYPQIRRVSSFTVYAFKVSTFLQSSVARDFALIRIKNGLFISRADSESQLCLQHNKPKRVVYFFLCICKHCPKVTNFVSFLAWDQYGESRAGEGGPIMPAQVANQNTGFTSSCPRALLAI